MGRNERLRARFSVVRLSRHWARPWLLLIIHYSVHSKKKEIDARSFFSAAESPSSFARTFVWRLGSLLPMRAVCRTST